MLLGFNEISYSLREWFLIPGFFSGFTGCYDILSLILDEKAKGLTTITFLSLNFEPLTFEWKEHGWL